MTYTEEQTQFNTIGQRADADIARLTTQLTAVNGSLTQALADLAEARNALEVARSDDSAAAAQIAKLKADLATLTTARDALVADRDRIAAELTAAKSDDAADEAQIAKMAADLTAANARIAQLVAGSAVQDGRPTGPGYVSLESLYKTGDTIQTVLNKVTNRNVLTVGEGRWEMPDFLQGYNACIDVPKACGGIVGVSPGAFGEARGTVFTIKPNSQTRGNLVPVQTSGGTDTNEFMLLKSSDAPGPLEFRKFAWEGTDQGADYKGNFGGFKIYNQKYGVIAEDLRGSGTQGNAGAPPGETMIFYINGSGKISAKRISLDGRRTVDGRMFAAVGMTIQNNNGAYLEDIAVRSCRAAGFVVYQATNGKIKNLTIDSATQIDSTEPLGNGGLNLERSAGWEITKLDILGRQKKVHITHSNDSYVLVTPDGSYPVANGSLTLIDPKWNDLWGNQRLYIQSWDPYGVGANSAYGSNSMLWPSGAAKVIHTDGVVRTYQHIISGIGHVMASVPA